MKPKKVRYPDSKATRLGRELLSGPPELSSEITDVDVIAVVSGSYTFAREFLDHFGSAGALAHVRSPRELLVLPAATPAVVGRVYMAYEWAARVISLTEMSV